MTDQTGATGGEAVAELALPADAPEEFANANEAARYFTELTEKRNKQPAESADTATAENELSGEDNAAPERAPGENEGDGPEENLPPIPRPRSWSKDDDDEWAALPRTRQEKIAANEQAREADINQKISKATETAKAAEAKAAQADQVKAQYESRLAEQMQSLVEYNNSQFSAIKSQADVDFLTNEAVRLANAGNFVEAQQYQVFLTAWRSHQDKMASKRYELDQAEGEKTRKHQTEWAKFVQEESSAFSNATPEYTAKKADYDTKAADILREIGFTDDELNKLASGEEKIPLFDRRIQRLLFDRIKLSEIRAAPKAIAKIPVPPVVRPGTSRPAGSYASEREQALTRKDELSVAEATELYTMQQNRQRRAS
jgi:hypothetical protein